VRRPSLNTWLFALLVIGLVLALGGLYAQFLAQQVGALVLAYGGANYELASPKMLGALVALPLLLIWARYSLADLPWQQRALAVVFRGVFLSLCVLALARPSVASDSDRVCTVFLVDVSDSVTDASIEEARQFIQASLRELPTDDEVRLVSFARRPRLEQLRASPEQPYVVPSTQQLRHSDAASAATDPTSGPSANSAGGATDIQAALQLAYGVFPADALKHALLFSDGVETAGDLMGELGRAQSLAVKIFAVPFTAPPPSEVAIRSLQVPAKVAIGEPFKLEAEIYSTRATQVRARLYQGEMLNGLDGVRELKLNPGVNNVAWNSVVRVGGEVSYTLRIDPGENDTFKVNNQFKVRVDVPGRPLILYIEGQSQRASYLAGALTAQQFDVDIRTAAAFPTTLLELERFDLVILSDVPAEAVSVSTQDLIERYVRDLGGGFVFAGGEAGYGLGGWAHTPLERILPVSMDAQRKKDMPGVALALVIDRSGSMSGLPMEMAKSACAATVATLQADDLIEVIAFDGTPTRYVKMQPARYRNRIQNDVMRIQLGGGTAIFPALDAAYQDMSVTQARRKHVILLTDGHADTQGLRDLAQSMLADSITVTTVGLGDGADGDLLRMIAENGGGRYHSVPDPNSLPRIFTRETEMISRQAAVQEWFPVTQTASADFLRGIAINTAPLLHGYVATQLKPPPAQQILASDVGEPILARWRVGLGYTVAWTSDVKNNWSVDWLRWTGFSQFWGQLAREHMRKKSQRELDMKTSLHNGQVKAVVDAYTADERFDNRMTSKLFIRGEANREQDRVVAMEQVAPGRYEASFRVNGFGAFSLRAEHYKERADGNLDQVAVSFGQVSNPYPAEYAAFEPDLERLTRVASITGASLSPSFATLFDAGGDKLVTRAALWSRCLYAALVAFLFDLLVRRVRLFDRGFRAATQRG
jgi:Ca-activated chloride channel homolog